MKQIIIEMGAYLRWGGENRISETLCHTLRANMGDNHPVVLEEYSGTDNLLQHREIPSPGGVNLEQKVVQTIRAIKDDNSCVVVEIYNENNILPTRQHDRPSG